ncbi:hypothetical protein M0804_009578 [Polistes exclamans]|nr:hypothetical protein M0804_009578 [Polistes exclamans]
MSILNWVLITQTLTLDFLRASSIGKEDMGLYLIGRSRNPPRFSSTSSTRREQKIAVKWILRWDKERNPVIKANGDGGPALSLWFSCHQERTSLKV